VPFVITDGHACATLTKYSNQLDHLKRIDWKILQNSDFSRDNDDPDKTNRYMAEALVHKLLPIDALLYVACCDEKQKTWTNDLVSQRNLKLTSARALVAELVRRYSVLGFECTLLEIQKLAYLLQRRTVSAGLASPLKLTFQADKFGPYAPTLGHLLNSLDGSYLHCEKRVVDASVLDTIWFESAKKDVVATYLKTTDAKEFSGALDETTSLIDGFEFPLGMELLTTVDWLLDHDKVEPSLDGVKKGLASWLGGGEASQRKLRLFDDGMIELALSRLKAN
jgi:hypothetical protein